MGTKFSKRIWILLWICLIVINVVMRIPVTPHEIGHDSFLEHYLGDSLSVSGHAKWWLHPLSIIGLYPLSVSSALPFFLSGVSQSLPLAMEWTIWIVMASLGIFSVFTAYLMAGAIKDDKTFKFVAALVYSTSPGILFETTWSASGRGLFLAILPLFIYLLIKSRFSKIKYNLLVLIMLILLLATHNLFYITIPIILSYLIVITISNFQIKSSNYYGGLILVILFIIFFIQFSISNVSIITLIKGYTRYIGVFGLFIIGGFISLLFKNNKTLEDKFIIMILFFLVPALSIQKYSKFFILPFEALLVSYAVWNLVRISQKRNVALFVILISILLSVGLAEYFQFGRIDGTGSGEDDKFWAEESTVNAAMWIGSFSNKMVFTDEVSLSRRILAYSGVEMFSEYDMIYLIQDKVRYINVSMRSPFSVLFYSDGPFEVVNMTGMSSWAWYKIVTEGLDSRWAWLIQDNKVNYYIRKVKTDTAFSRSFKEESKLFDNGEINIWKFNK